MIDALLVALAFILGVVLSPLIVEGLRAAHKYARSLFQHCSHTLRAYWRAYVLRRDHYLLERYGMAEKPPRWNRDVLTWFHAGPERRVPTEDFRSAFHDRAKVPPPKAITPKG